MGVVVISSWIPKSALGTASQQWKILEAPEFIEFVQRSFILRANRKISIGLEAAVYDAIGVPVGNRRGV